MPRLRSVYRCQDCGRDSPKWAGQCPECGAWNTLVEEAVEERAAAGPSRGAKPLTRFSSEVVKLSEAPGADAARLPTGIVEVDRLL